jgi:hypothetical protein
MSRIIGAMSDPPPELQLDPVDVNAYTWEKFWDDEGGVHRWTRDKKLVKFVRLEGLQQKYYVSSWEELDAFSQVLGIDSLQHVEEVALLDDGSLLLCATLSEFTDTFHSNELRVRFFKGTPKERT